MTGWCGEDRRIVWSNVASDSALAGSTAKRRARPCIPEPLQQAPYLEQSSTEQSGTQTIIPHHCI